MLIAEASTYMYSAQRQYHGDDRMSYLQPWSNWTFTFKPACTIIFAAEQSETRQVDTEFNTCKEYLSDALTLAQTSPTDWWNEHGRSVYYLMQWDQTGSPPFTHNLVWCSMQPHEVIPWLNLKLGALEQAARFEGQREAATAFLLTWAECSRIEENPIRD